MAIRRLKRPTDTEEPVTRKAIRALRGPLAMVGLFSLLINLLVLTLPLYMMNLFDRVLTSLSVPTLIALTSIAVGLLVSYGFLEAIRSRLMVRLSVKFDEMVTERIFRALFLANLEQTVGGGTLAQVEQIRGFLNSQTLIAFFDLPFALLFLTVLFLLHPLLGAAAVLSTVVVFLVGMSTEWLCKREMLESTKEARKAAHFADNSMRNAEVIAALGMMGNLRNRWISDHQQAIDNHTVVSNRMAAITGAMKTSSQLIQVLIMALACYLVILGLATAGVLFAVNVLVARILGPVQHTVSAWRSVLGIREAFTNLNKLLESLPSHPPRLKLPPPSGFLQAEKLAVAPPGTTLLTLQGVSFKLEPGQAMGILGPSASGKSTLARLLVGVWRPTAGHVRLDGADVHTWDFDDLGPHLGYLPQDIELFDGTIADNICRFGPRDDEAIIHAAQKVGLHEIILRQDQGYETSIRSNGGLLSGGQRQRLGLARAVYGNPRLIVLDEPNSNLDGAGEKALHATIARLKSEGVTIVVIAHGVRMMKAMDKLLWLQEGKQRAFGDRDAVLAKFIPAGKVVAALPEPEDDSEEAEAETAPAASAGGRK